MAYEVVARSFRTEAEARWSVFLDALEVPYVYAPARFVTAAGEAFAPSFWLPEDRIWLVLSSGGPPGWWAPFVHTVRPAGPDGSAGLRRNAAVVREEWHGSPILVHTCAHPDAPYHGCPQTGSEDLIAPGGEVLTWLRCQGCGRFVCSAYGQTPPCGCGEGADDDPRLSEAAHWAAQQVIGSANDPPGTGGLSFHLNVIMPAGSGAAEPCEGGCRSLGDALRAELPDWVHHDLDPGFDTTCVRCPHPLCDACGRRPATDAGEGCLHCAPVTAMSKTRARQVLNDLAGQAGSAAGLPAREINTLLNRARRARSRADFTLHDLAEALTLAEKWAAAPATIPRPAPAAPLSEKELEDLEADALRPLLNSLAARLSGRSRMPIAHVQAMLNELMGVEQRGEADDEALREAVGHAQLWHRDPHALRAYTEGVEDVAPGALPPVMSTRVLRTGITCTLCTGTITAGETAGRLHIPQSWRGPRLGRLCGHCLTDRRTKPRPVDLVLRLFHGVLATGWARLNACEAEALLGLLPDVAPQNLAPGLETAFFDALVILRHAVESGAVEELVPFRPARAVAEVLRTGPVGDATTRSGEILAAVVEHFAEWDDPPLLNPDAYRFAYQCREDMLRQTPGPTLLSRRPHRVFV
ncbi:hypothetical protein [Streptomyces californicus]|uniref:hypothetical protein n=1 Tax=Streptomyces californicus TaxID=67351 RepID=UPI0037A44634